MTFSVRKYTTDTYTSVKYKKGIIDTCANTPTHNVSWESNLFKDFCKLSPLCIFFKYLFERKREKERKWDWERWERMSFYILQFRPLKWLKWQELGLTKARSPEIHPCLAHGWVGDHILRPSSIAFTETLVGSWMKSGAKLELKRLLDSGAIGSNPTCWVPTESPLLLF